MNTKRYIIAVLLGIGVALPAFFPAKLPAGDQAITVRSVYPNPFTVGTTFQLTMPRTGQIRIAVHDILGKQIKTLFEGEHPSGRYDIYWDGKDETGSPVIPGIYICSLFSSDSYVTSVKVVKVQG
ncbi:MAG TPA: T9SS type A sorting domain-containing protein [Candidatus Kapabacteria bacterium]|nr:T9SS type A sorting domain-containing protein [Candidatus Kapabacteria bacterium]